MATVYSPNIIEIAVMQKHNTVTAVNVWHMWFDPELGSDTVEDVVGDFRDNWQDHILDMQTSEVVVEEFRWRSLDPSSGAMGVIAPDPAKATSGQASGTTMPPNVALLLHKRTSDRLRGQRDGRSFLAGVSEGDVNGRGTITPATRSGWQVSVDAFYNGISDTSGSAAGDRYPAVLNTTPASRAPGSQSVTISSRRVTSIQLDALVSTQRDRLR